MIFIDSEMYSDIWDPAPWHQDSNQDASDQSDRLSEQYVTFTAARHVDTLVVAADMRRARTATVGH